MQVNTSGAYAGIGVEVAPSTQGVSVIRRMSGSPAERAGIRTGDVIVRIDDIAVDPRDVNAAIERMRGPERQHHPPGGPPRRGTVADRVQDRSRAGDVAQRRRPSC